MDLRIILKIIGNKIELLSGKAFNIKKAMLIYMAFSMFSERDS